MQFYKITVLFGSCAILMGCSTNYPYPQPQMHPQAQATSIHYGPVSAPPAASAMHAAPPVAPVYPKVDPTYGSSEITTMRYGN